MHTPHVDPVKLICWDDESLLTYGFWVTTRTCPPVEPAWDKLNIYTGFSSYSLPTRTHPPVDTHTPYPLGHIHMWTHSYPLPTRIHPPVDTLLPPTHYDTSTCGHTHTHYPLGHIHLWTHTYPLPTRTHPPVDTLIPPTH